MLKVGLEAKSRESQPQLQREGKGEPSAEPRARRLHPAMSLEGEGWLLEQQRVPRLPITAPSQKSSSSSNVWLFKSGLSILWEITHPEEEGLICQGFHCHSVAAAWWGGGSGSRGGGSGRRDGHSGVGAMG